MRKTKIYAFSFVILFAASCTKDELPEFPGTGYLHGTFVVNEGAFLNVNSSVSHIGEDNVVVEDAYYETNSAFLGDVLQSFFVHSGKGYAVLNNSQKVVVVDLISFRHKAVIAGCDYPRYFLTISENKAYLTNGSMGGEVLVVDLQTNSITAEIEVGNGPENLVQSGNFLFVCNSGGWLTDNTVSVIDIGTDTVIESITVGDRPTDIVADGDGNIWVLCAGETFYDVDYNVTGHSPASLHKIDSSVNQVVESWTLGSLGDHPRSLSIGGDGYTIYYDNNGVYAFNSLSATPPGMLLIDGTHYGMEVSPNTDEIWTAQMPDFVNKSTVRKHNKEGNMLLEYEAGIGSNGFVFN